MNILIKAFFTIYYFTTELCSLCSFCTFHLLWLKCFVFPTKMFITKFTVCQNIISLRKSAQIQSTSWQNCNYLHDTTFVNIHCKLGLCRFLFFDPRLRPRQLARLQDIQARGRIGTPWTKKAALKKYITNLHLQLSKESGTSKITS